MSTHPVPPSSALSAKRMPPVAISLFALAATCTSFDVNAIDFDMTNPDFEARLDTTVRYNSGWRTSGRENGLVNTNTDEGNYLFDKGDQVLSRVDIYSEFDLTYQGRYGARLSAAGWYDNNFPDKGESDPRFASQASYPNNRYSGYVDRYYQGPSAEFMDAFVWGNFNLGSTNLNVKAGRFAWLPGEFVFGNGGSVSYSMAPNDGMKSDLSPGASAKETALPIEQIGGIWQLTPQWSLMTQYTLEFRPSRISEGGTFFQVADVALEGPPRVNSLINRRDAHEGDNGDIAVGLKWQPDWADGDAFGLWYRRFDDKTASWNTQTVITGLAGPIPTSGYARAVHAKDIELYGLTYNTLLDAWTVGAELNYRKNMPLLSTGSFLALGGAPEPDLEGARGNTLHALLSGIMTINKNSLFDSGALALQLDYTRLQSVTSNKARFNGRDSDVAGRCQDHEVLRGCATRDALSLSSSFTPTWQQAFPSVDLSMPIVALYGIDGNAAAVGAGTLPEKSWLLRVGGRAEWLLGTHKHQFDLSYTTRDGMKDKLPGASTNSYSGLANLRDRDYVIFTYQTAF